MSEEEQIIQTPAEFGQFVLEKELGHGGMGGVYLGHDKMLDRKVAIKVMLKSLGEDATFVERFQREAQAAAKLNHPNIAQIYSFGQQDGMPYIAMELVSGGSLDKKMAEQPGKLDPIWVMRVGQQLAEGLSVAAEGGLVHGDMKPENVLFDADGNAKIVDFGLAAMHADSDEIWGTPYYISPEKVRKQKLDYRADMYSLGGTLYHALTGVAPFEGADAIAVVKARFEGMPKKPSEVRPDLPPEVDDIIMRMLALEPGARHPTYQSLLGDFRRFLDKLGSSQTKTKPRVVLKGKRKKLTATTDDIPELPPVDLAELSGSELPAEGEEGGKKKLSIGAIVGLVIGGVFLLIALVVGGLFWYVHATKASEEAAEAKQIADKKQEAIRAITGTLEQADKFGVQFEELVTKMHATMDEQTGILTKQLTPEMLEALGGKVKQLDVQELEAAIAYTNQLLSAEAKAPEASAAPAKDNAQTNAVAKAEDKSAKAQTNAVASATNAVAKAEGKPAAGQTNAVAKAEAKAAEVQPEQAEDKAAEAAPEVEVPASVRQFADLWKEVAYADGALIRVRGGIVKVKQLGEKMSTLTDDTVEVVEQLAKLSVAVADELNAVKSAKWVEMTQRKSGLINQRAANLVEAAGKQIERAAAKAAKAAKVKAEAEAKAAAAKEEAEAKAALAKEEVEAVNTKGEELMESRIKRLMWESALKDLERMKGDLKSFEGLEALRAQTVKVESFKALHDCFIKFAKGLTFTVKGMDYTITKSDADGLTVSTVKHNGGKNAKPKVEKLRWEKVFGSQPLLFNQLINRLVVKGRLNTHTALRPWSQQMFGAAMSMQLFYGDATGVAQRVPQLVKQAVKEFPDCQMYAEKFFPDIKLGDDEE